MNDMEMKLSRYLDFDAFASMLGKGIYMSAPNEFDDEWEGLMLAYWLNRKRFHGLREDLDQFRTWLYVSCWHAGQHESHAMWKVYGKNKGSIAIETSEEKLVNAFCEENQATLAYCGPVQYVNPDQDHEAQIRSGEVRRLPNQPKDELVRLESLCLSMYLKHFGFEWEKEVRLVALDPNYDEYRSNPNIRMHLKPSNWGDFIERIVASPHAEDRFIEEVSDVAHKYGVTCKVERSKLQMPKFD